MRQIRGLVVLGLSFGLSGCGVSKVYRFMQLADGLNMQAPIEHLVRVHVYPEQHAVDWIEDIRDKNGKSDRQIYSFARKDCPELFDEENWTCGFYSVGGNSSIVIEMKGGALSRKYWGEEQKFYRHYFLFGTPVI